MLLVLLLKLAFLSSIVGFVNAAGGEHEWNYWGEKGPNNWVKYYQKCNGTRQSPINIDTNNVKYNTSLGDILFTNYNVSTAANFTAKNDGHTFSLSFDGYSNATVPSISEGGLPGTFKLIGFQFHWGVNSSRGAEHQINGVSYPAELHLVHINVKYDNLSTAKEQSDGLAVLGVFIKEGKRNDVFENFLNLTKYNVTYPGMMSKVTPFELILILPGKKTFYRYEGSLTTPGCHENVTWTVFDNAIEISKEQLVEFRKLKYRDSNNSSQPLVDNFRPVQPLNGRMVSANFNPIKSTSVVRPTSTSETTGASTTVTSETTGTSRAVDISKTIDPTVSSTGITQTEVTGAPVTFETIKNTVTAGINQTTEIGTTGKPGTVYLTTSVAITTTVTVTNNVTVTNVAITRSITGTVCEPNNNPTDHGNEISRNLELILGSVLFVFLTLLG